MSHTTPATYLVWSLLSGLLGIFLVYHLWKFDRFRCLKWNNGPYSGAFKRLMTYTYLFSVPCIMGYAIGFAVIKYQEGFVDLPGYGIIPKPWQLWTQTHKSFILPLYLLFTVAWSLEMVTHLEELCFWLFLVNSGSVQQDWFRSLYFKTWIVGSVIAVAYMPLVTVFTRSDPLKCEAFTFLAGSLGSLSLTLWFMPILWTFPSFVKNLKRNGVDTRTVSRLKSFHELNCIRVVFRFLFVLPLMVLAVDGVRPHQHVNENPFWTEFLTCLAAIGCVVSSAITLVIFFPRSTEPEVQSRQATRERTHNGAPRADSRYSSYYNKSAAGHVDADRDDTTSSSRGGASPLPQKRAYSPEPLTPASGAGEDKFQYPPPTESDHHGLLAAPLENPLPVFSPNRRVSSGAVVEGKVLPPSRLTERALAAHNERNSRVHPFLHNFTSPIDIMEGQPKRWYVKRQDHLRESII